ncbi:hypothetical protein D1007_27526 [Hordeum vulgare]|nr:hypothetical protein D1007_27526 [Hordeum vulgare]
MHCWLKLNGQSKWNNFIAKTAPKPTDPTQESPNKIRREFPRKKWEEERAKREGPIVTLKEKFEDILLKKEEAYVTQSDIKDEKKMKRFKLLMEATVKKLAIKEKRALIEEKAMLEDKKIAFQRFSF